MENLKEVYYDKYCPSCKYVSMEDDKSVDVCNECLNNPGMPDSHKPLNYKEKK